MIAQEDKELLLKDLCARQPYSVMINTPLFEKPTLLKGIADNMCWAVVDEDNYEWVDIDDVKPYLRPLSSMTDEEKNELDLIIDKCNKKVFTCPKEERKYNFFDMEQVHFYLSHHFDINELILKNLAIEAPEEMYVQEEKKEIVKI